MLGSNMAHAASSLPQLRLAAAQQELHAGPLRERVVRHNLAGTNRA